MFNIQEMIERETENGYSEEKAVSLLINSDEQMFAEKLRSLLRFGPVSTRFKDVFDLRYLSNKVDKEKLKVCLESYIYNDSAMKENDILSILKRIEMTFNNETYYNALESSEKNWLDENMDSVLNNLLNFLCALNKE